MREKVRIAVLVSGGGTNLQALLDAESSGELKSAEVVLVVANREDAFALERAKIAQKRTAIVSSAKRSRADFERELVKVLEEENIELIVLAGFLCILTEEFVARYPQRIINVHPALIPAFCGKGYYGRKVHQAALDYGVKITGATVHFVNEIPDGGKILLQKAVSIEEGDTAESLQKRVMEQAEWVILPKAVEMVASELADEKARGKK
ncbi:MAG: phosphoribosylglycinamide formyltransferase [Clostridia bacterium]|nr:phosphoribosylglycinamide formyltransferase [Clostridia bacterium]